MYENCKKNIFLNICWQILPILTTIQNIYDLMKPFNKSYKKGDKMEKKQPTYNDLKIMYDTIKAIMGDKDIYYTPEEVEDLKKDKTNIFLVRENTYEKRRTWWIIIL